MTSIITMDSDKGKISFIIPHIVFVNLKDSSVNIVLNCTDASSFYSLNFPGKLEAEGAYLRITNMIESYYDAMMLNNSGCSCKDK